MENTTPFIVLRMIEYKCWEGSQNDKSMSIKGSFLSLLQPSLHCSYSIFLFGLNDISCFVWEPCIFINERGWWLPAILATFQVAVIGDNCQFSPRGGSDFSMLAAKKYATTMCFVIEFCKQTTMEIILINLFFNWLQVLIRCKVNFWWNFISE